VPRRLERIRHLLHLVQIELEACGGCTGGVSRRMDAALHLINELMELKARHEDGDTHDDADDAVGSSIGSAGGARSGAEET
jgi:hypothetical protein